MASYQWDEACLSSRLLSGKFQVHLECNQTWPESASWTNWKLSRKHVITSTLRSVFFVTICDPSETGRSLGALWSPSIKTVDFVDRKLFLRLLSIKSGVFVDGNVTDQKETPLLGCLCKYMVMRSPIRSGMTSWQVESSRHVYIVMAGLTGHLLLIQRSSNVNSASNA